MMFQSLSELDSSAIKSVTVPLGLLSNGPLIDRSFREALPHQYDRELVCNAVEAGATEIQISPDWIHLAERLRKNETPVYRYLCADNGKGMSPEDLEKFFNNISASGHDLQNGDNFGVGAKISLLPWNPEGIVVMSWTKENPQGAMIRIVKRASDLNYGLWMQQDEDGIYQKVNAAPQEYKDKYLPKSLSGTIVIALGKHSEDDTYHGPNFIEHDVLSPHLRILNQRFFNLPDRTTVRMAVFNNSDKELWPRSDMSGVKSGFFWQKVKGAKHHLDLHSTKAGILALKDVKIHWWIIDPATANPGNFTTSTFIAAMYGNEVYNMHVGRIARSRYTSFGILFEEVKKRLVLIVEPTNGLKTVYYPNTARSAMVCGVTENQELPWVQWGSLFADNMPPEIKELCDKFSQVDEFSSAKGVKDRLKDFLNRLIPNVFKKSPASQEVASIQQALLPQFSSGGGSGSGTEAFEKARQAKQADGSTIATVRKVTARNEPPKPLWVDASDMSEENTAAEYVEALNTIKINKQFFVFNEVLQYWVSKYPDMPKIEGKIQLAIRDVYQLKLVSGVMQAYYMASLQSWANTWRELITPQALTAMVLGLVNEHNVIQQRLNFFGRKKAD